MTDNRLLELAERVEAATAEQQREMLVEAWWLLSGMADSRNRGLAAIDSRFERMLDAEAYESAAMTLVPEGWYWRAGHGVLWPGWAHLNRKHPDHCDRDDEHSAHAETPALALVAAALRARANGEASPNSTGDPA